MPSHLRFLLFAVIAMFVPAFAIAQASAPASLPADVTTADFLQSLLQALGSLKGATTLGFVVVGVQVLLKFFESPLANWAGKWRLTVVFFLTVPATALALKLQGLSWLVALLSGPVLAAVQVFAHQVYAQFTEKPAPVVAAVKS